MPAGTKIHMSTQRIVSLLPAATELACALGLENQLVGISSECDYPPEIRQLPRVVSSVINSHHLSPRDIDNAVRQRAAQGQNLYLIDEDKLAALKPDLILTQDLCQVCAPSGNELAHVLKKWELAPRIVYMSPHSLADIEQNLNDLAALTDKQKRAQELITSWRRRKKSVHDLAMHLKHKPRVLVMEWVDPIYATGHWFAEMIQIAGGEDMFARPGADSQRVEWQQVLHWQPEIIVVAPCGYNQSQAESQIAILEQLPDWKMLPAVRQKRVYAVDANAYFVRPGPRVFDGLEILADLFRIF